MLACQGALNFTLWTGEEAPLEVMREQLRREFGLSVDEESGVRN